MDDHSFVVTRLRELGFRASWCEVNAWTQEQRDDLMVMLDCIDDRSIRIRLPPFVQRPTNAHLHEVEWSAERIVISVSFPHDLLGKSNGMGEPVLIAAKWSAVEEVEQKMFLYGLEPVDIRTEYKPGELKISIAHMPTANFNLPIMAETAT